MRPILVAAPLALLFLLLLFLFLPDKEEGAASETPRTTESEPNQESTGVIGTVAKEAHRGEIPPALYAIAEDNLREPSLHPDTVIHDPSAMDDYRFHRFLQAVNQRYGTDFRTEDFSAGKITLSDFARRLP